MKDTSRKRCAARSGLPREATEHFRTIRYPIRIAPAHHRDKSRSIDRLRGDNECFKQLEGISVTRSRRSRGLESIRWAGSNGSDRAGGRSIDVADCPTEDHTANPEILERKRKNFLTIATKYKRFTPCDQPESSSPRMRDSCFRVLMRGRQVVQNP